MKKASALIAVITFMLVLFAGGCNETQRADDQPNDITPTAEVDEGLYVDEEAIYIDETIETGNEADDEEPVFETDDVPSAEIKSVTFTVPGYDFDITITNPADTYYYRHAPAKSDPILPASESRHYSIPINSDSIVVFSRSVTGSYFDSETFSVVDVTYSADTPYAVADLAKGGSFNGGKDGDVAVGFAIYSYDKYVEQIASSWSTDEFYYDVEEELLLTSGKLSDARP